MRIDEENIQRSNQRKQEGVFQIADDILARANRNMVTAQNYVAQVQQFWSSIFGLFSQQDGLNQIRCIFSQTFWNAHNLDGLLVGKIKLYQQADDTPKKASIL